jgi:preprotein translocase subunit YajC
MNIIIINKTTKIELQKDQIIEVLETADGVAFNMRNGLSLIFIDNFMPATAKNLIKGTIDQCNTDNVTITINLENHRTPASIMVNSVAPPVKDDK